jgi:DNA polymerase-3 subunit alpha
MFVHLRLHTEFSVVDGTTRIDDIVQAAAADAQPALAITDLNNLFGAVKFYKAARGGVKPLLGAEIGLDGLTETPARVLLLVQNQAGYLNLSQLLTRPGPRASARARPWCWDWLRRHAEGLMLLSGAQAGPLGQPAAGRRAHRQRAGAAAGRGLSAPLLLELQRAGRPTTRRTWPPPCNWPRA